jgi:hypothetical protein
MRVLGVLLACFGTWSCTWGIWAVHHRKRPHDLLGMAMTVLGIVALGMGLLVLVQPRALF